jgi:hypothetical protein
MSMTARILWAACGITGHPIADTLDRQDWVRNVGWAVGSGNVVPMAGLQRDVGQQAAGSEDKPRANSSRSGGLINCLSSGHSH